MKILHFSDLHLQDRIPDGLSWLFDKRLLGTCTQHLRRAPKQDFKTIPRLLELAKDEKPDAIVCTGDPSSVAMAAEFQRAERALDPMKDLVGHGHFIFIPGNHDRYVDRQDARTALRRLNEHLNDMEEDVDFHTLQRKLGTVTCFLMDAARPMPPWSSGGVADDRQIDELDRMAGSAKEERELRVLVCHFPLMDSRGRRLSPRRRMRGDLEIRDIMARNDFDAMLCGHIHTPFLRQVDGWLQICPGSLTLHHQAAIIETDDRGLKVRLVDVLTRKQLSHTAHTRNH